MTKKKRVIISLSDEAYTILVGNLDLIHHFCDKDYKITSKSQFIEMLLKDYEYQFENI